MKYNDKLELIKNIKKDAKIFIKETSMYKIDNEIESNVSVLHKLD